MSDCHFIVSQNQTNVNLCSVGIDDKLNAADISSDCAVPCCTTYWPFDVLPAQWTALPCRILLCTYLLSVAFGVVAHLLFLGDLGFFHKCTSMQLPCNTVNMYICICMYRPLGWVALSACSLYYFLSKCGVSHDRSSRWFSINDSRERLWPLLWVVALKNTLLEFNKGEVKMGVVMISGIFPLWVVKSWKGLYSGYRHAPRFSVNPNERELKIFTKK